MFRTAIPVLALVATASFLPAQVPQYHVTPALRPGQSLDTLLIGAPNRPFAALVDLNGGPISFLGETLLLGFGPSTALLDVGVIPVGGLRFLQVPTPGSGVPLGVPLFLQALVFDPAAPNGLFRASDGESAAFYQSRAVLVENFRNPAAEGITGGFDPTVRGRLQGGAVQRRTHTVAIPGRVPFSSAVRGPLSPNGARVQMVYRAGDIGADGQPELLTEVRWRPFPGSPVSDETYQRLAIDVSHSAVVPNYTVGLFSALPLFPNSGLSMTFAANPKAGETPVRAYDGPYAIQRANLRPDGYLGYPTFTQRFRYNGVDSLLLDFRMVPSPTTPGVNGQSVGLMVQSSPRPNSRALDAGTFSQPVIVNPFASTAARMASNTVHDAQFEFARVASQALSPWRAAPVQNPDYDQPSVAASVPAGASIVVEYRGAQTASGGSATAWSTDINVADAHPFLQWRISFAGEPVTGGVPSVDALVIPVN